MGLVTEPPDEVYSLGYSWRRGHASGGTRELFTSENQVVDRIDALTREYGENLSNLTVLRLVPLPRLDGDLEPPALTWRRLGVRHAQPTRVGVDQLPTPPEKP